MIATTSRIIENATQLKEAVISFQIAQGYFSYILNAQLVIFSLIVAAIVGLYFFFNKQASKDQIKNEVEKGVKEIKEEMGKEFEEKSKETKVAFVEEIIRHDQDITGLRGEVARQMGQFWDSQKSYSTSFIWWIRSASYFAKAKDDKLTRIALNSAKDTIQNIQYAFQIDYDILGEYQKLFSEIDDGAYKIEKDLLDKSIKEALNKKSK